MKNMKNIMNQNSNLRWTEPDTLEYLWRLAHIASAFPSKYSEDLRLFLQRPDYRDETWITEMRYRSKPRTVLDYLRFDHKWGVVNKIDTSLLKLADTLVMLYQHQRYYTNMRYSYQRQFGNLHDDFCKVVQGAKNYLAPDDKALDAVRHAYSVVEATYGRLFESIQKAQNEVFCMAKKFCILIYETDQAIPESILEPFVSDALQYRNYLTLAADLRARIPMLARQSYPGSENETLLRLASNTTQTAVAFHTQIHDCLDEYYSVCQQLDTAVLATF